MSDNSELEPMPCMCCDTAPPSIMKTLMCYNPSVGGNPDSLEDPTMPMHREGSHVMYRLVYQVGTTGLNLAALSLLYFGDWRSVYKWKKMMQSEFWYLVSQVVLFIVR